jgi:Peptidase A4 family/Double zinc ribbon
MNLSPLAVFGSLSILVMLVTSGLTPTLSSSTGGAIALPEAVAGVNHIDPPPRSDSVAGLSNENGPVSGLSLTGPRISRDSTQAPVPDVITGTSANWAGYGYCPAFNGTGCPTPAASTEVVGVQGSWVVPAIASTNSTEESAATWVGIGGVSSNDLIQAGINEALVNGQVSIDAWWEMLPDPSTPIALSPHSTISAGDVIFVQIFYVGLSSGGYQEWSFLLSDNTTGSVWTGTETCGAGCTPSTFSTADWIEESPALLFFPVQLPAFGSVKVTHAAFVVASGSWTLLSASTAPLIDFSLEDPLYSSVVQALASAIYAEGSFWLQYLVDAVDPLLSGTPEGVTSAVREPGQVVNASVSITSPDAFGSGDATTLALAIQLWQSTSVACLAASSPLASLTVASGTKTYTTQGNVCQGAANGAYSASVSLWYVPPGGEIGGVGSIELFSTGTQNGTLIMVDGPVAGPVTIAPTSGTMDIGQSARLNVTPSSGTPPYTLAWVGLPSGCQTVSGDNFTCAPTLTGDFPIHATVTDAIGVTASSPNATLIVLPDPVASIVLASRSSLQDASVAFGSVVSGGAAPFTYEWRGLPAGCGSTNASFTCSPSSTGSYQIQLVVTDQNGWTTQTNVSLLITPAILGLSLWFFLALVTLGALALALVALLASSRWGTRPTETPSIAERVRSYSPGIGPAPTAGETIPASEVWAEPQAETVAPYWQVPAPADSTCRRCGKVMPPGSLYCGRCAMPLDRSSRPPANGIEGQGQPACIQCGNKMPVGAIYCGVCGNPLTVGQGSPSEESR